MGFDEMNYAVINSVKQNLQNNSFKWYFGESEEEYFQPVCYDVACFYGVVPELECVYFLFDSDKQLLYIGQTKNFRLRAISHKTEKRIPFTHYCVITTEMMGIEAGQLKRLEQAAIARHKPPLNRIYYIA